MLKYIKEYAASINRIDVYPTISLMIFFVFFVAVLYYVKKMDERFIANMDHLSLDSGEAVSQQPNSI